MKIINTIIATTVLTISLHAQDASVTKSQMSEAVKSKTVVKPYYQGTISEMIQSGGYTYLLINENIPGYDKEKLKSFWISVTRTEAKVGDYVRFKKELVMKDFKSKTLNRTFPEIMFASSLEYKITK